MLADVDVMLPTEIDEIAGAVTSPTEGVGYQPVTSTTRCVVPALLNRLILPSAPTPTTTALGTVRPATTFRFDAFGRGMPAGHTVMNGEPEGSVAVTFNATAATPVAGTPW